MKKRLNSLKREARQLIDVIELGLFYRVTIVPMLARWYSLYSNGDFYDSKVPLQYLKPWSQLWTATICKLCKKKKNPREDLLDWSWVGTCFTMLLKGHSLSSTFLFGSAELLCSADSLCSSGFPDKDFHLPYPPPSSHPVLFHLIYKIDELATINSKYYLL